MPKKEEYDALDMERAQATNQAKPINEGRETLPNEPAMPAYAQEGQSQGQDHPHGGPPGQTGENPGHGGEPPGQADKPAEPKPEPHRHTGHPRREA